MGLSIAFRDAEKLPARCSVAQVTSDVRRPGFEDEAIVPDGRWRSLRQDEVPGLRYRVGTPDSVAVELVRTTTPVTVEDCPNRPGPTTVTFFGDEVPADYRGWAASPPDDLTATVDWNTDRRIGIHLDNWDRLPYPDRHRSRRRLGVNLGPGPRYLILGTVDVKEMCRTLQPGTYRRAHPHTSHVRTYAAKTGLQLLRILLQPGEGYVAPTELLPHDGSTEGLPQPSTAAFWLGHWPMGTFPWAD
ncbi:hypothetical protein ACFU7Y_29845 [Kitasatospora sp. NPDC057542]|uniref:hypothetical protein n=1 Tax=Kitasatospora sp. NPDC057542 TaxID=3346162 RepID=UPI003697AFE8